MSIFVKLVHVSIEKFIANRISSAGQNKGNISKPIVKIGIIGIAVGISVMLLTVSIVLGFKKEIVDRITGLTTDIAISSVNVNASNEPEPIRIGADSLASIKKLPYVRYIQPTALKNGILKTETDNEGVLLKGVSSDYDFSFLKNYLVAGQLPGFKINEASKDVMISEALSNKLGLKINQKIEVYFIFQQAVYDSALHANTSRLSYPSRRFKICGIFKTNFSDFDQNLGIVDIQQLRQLNHWDKDLVGNYEVRLKDFDRLDENTEQLQELLGYRYKVNSVTDLYANIFTWLDKLDINGIVVVVLMILVATMNMVTALLILILERTNMVGLVKALGMTNASVRKVFIFISFRLIGKGLFWGNLVGISLCLIQYYFKLAKLDSAIYYVDHVAIKINWLYFLFLNLGTLTVCAGMLLLPTLIITKLTPVKTLKFD